MLSLHAMGMTHALSIAILGNICFTKSLYALKEPQYSSKKRENGTSSKTRWRMGHFGEALTDEFTVSAGGHGGVMQMSLPINALEEWHQHQQWKRLIDDGGGGAPTVYIRERPSPLPHWEPINRFDFFTAPIQHLVNGTCHTFFLEIRTEHLVRWRCII